jgi:hypothetical protein
MFIPSLSKSLYSRIHIKLIGNIILINDGVLQIVRKIERFGVKITSQFFNYFILDLVPSDSASPALDVHYKFWHTALCDPFQANMSQKLSHNGYLILDHWATFTCNLCDRSKSKHQVSNPVDSQSTEVCKLLHTDVCGPFPDEFYSSSIYL